MTTEAQLSKMLAAAGPMISSHVEKDGQSPTARYHCVFIHKNGIMRSNSVGGQSHTSYEWTYTPNK